MLGRTYMRRIISNHLIICLQDLTVQAGENRHALNRAQNFNDVTERAYGIQLGPVAATDLNSKETLTRPLVNVFQVYFVESQKKLMFFCSAPFRDATTGSQGNQDTNLMFFF